MLGQKVHWQGSIRNREGRSWPGLSLYSDIRNHGALKGVRLNNRLCIWAHYFENNSFIAISVMSKKSNDGSFCHCDDEHYLSLCAVKTELCNSWSTYTMLNNASIVPLVLYVVIYSTVFGLNYGDSADWEGVVGWSRRNSPVFTSTAPFHTIFIYPSNCSLNLQHVSYHGSCA